MTPRNFGAALAAAAASLFAGVLDAPASVLDVFSVAPNPVAAGGLANLDLQLTLIADPGYFGAQITGGSVTFSSGYGTSATVAIPVEDSTFANVGAAFSYADSGSYAPGFTAVVDYAEEYTAYGVLGYTYGVVGYSTAIVGTYPCGAFGRSVCYELGLLPEYGSIPQYGYYTASTTFEDTLNGSAELTATPLPAALPLFGAGLGALRLLTWRWKRKLKTTTVKTPCRTL